MAGNNHQTAQFRTNLEKEEHSNVNLGPCPLCIHMRYVILMGEQFPGPSLLYHVVPKITLS